MKLALEVVSREGNEVVIRLVVFNDSAKPVEFDRRGLAGPNGVPEKQEAWPVSLEPAAAGDVVALLGEGERHPEAAGVGEHGHPAGDHRYGRRLGYLEVDDGMRTSVEGLYACGDILAGHPHQVGESAATGALAATAVSYDLMDPAAR